MKQIFKMLVVIVAFVCFSNVANAQHKITQMFDSFPEADRATADKGNAVFFSFCLTKHREMSEEDRMEACVNDDGPGAGLTRAEAHRFFMKLGTQNVYCGPVYAQWPSEVAAEASEGSCHTAAAPAPAPASASIGIWDKIVEVAGLALPCVFQSQEVS